MKDCKKCGHVKTWDGDDIWCPFQKDGDFNKYNWNCGIIGDIRDLCESDKVARQRYNDQTMAMINTGVIEDEDLGYSLWVTWYKRRGRTESMWLLDSNKAPKRPTFEQLQKIVNFYK